MRSLLVLGLALLFLASAPTTSAAPTGDAYFSGDRYQQAGASGEKKRRYAKRYSHHQRAYKKRYSKKTRVAALHKPPARPPRARVIVTPREQVPVPPVTPLDDVAANPMYELSSYTRRALRKIDTYQLDVDVPEPQPARTNLFQEPPSFANVLLAPVNIIRGFFEFLLRPMSRCFEFETVDPRVKQVVVDAARHFGQEARISSCYRSMEYNTALYRRMGKRPTYGSYHIKRRALDASIPGVSSAQFAAFARAHPNMRRSGGIGRYAGTNFIHIDSGPKRNWCWGCGGGKKRMYAKRKKTRMASR